MEDPYPLENFLEIENNPHLLGRVVVSRSPRGFNVEVDIVQKESKKIFKHVENLYAFDNPDEALEHGVFKLSSFLKNLKH